MKNMKDVLINKIGGGFSEALGEISIKISDRSMGKCGFFAMYEPKIPLELLKENIKK